jgi:hypothetical protein
MRILPDECVPGQIHRHFSGHDGTTARLWAGDSS